MAKVHSERADNNSNRLEKRFGHPALHAELFTPMLHKNMMPLLSQVYQGKIGKDHAKLDEYGGKQMEAQIVPGGIKIAAIDQVCFFFMLFCHYHYLNFFFLRSFRNILNMIPFFTNVTAASSTGMHAQSHLQLSLVKNMQPPTTQHQNSLDTINTSLMDLAQFPNTKLS
jgi:hypothetical protein